MTVTKDELIYMARVNGAKFTYKPCVVKQAIKFLNSNGRQVNKVSKNKYEVTYVDN